MPVVVKREDRVTHGEVRAKFQQAIGKHEDLLTIVKRSKLQWYRHVSRSSGLAKTILQGTVKGGRRQGGQRKRWEDNIRKWIGLGFAKSQRAVENRSKAEDIDGFAGEEEERANLAERFDKASTQSQASNTWAQL